MVCHCKECAPHDGDSVAIVAPPDGPDFMDDVLTGIEEHWHPVVVVGGQEQ